MLVQVDVKKLINKLQTFNPEADLTGVKAYLLDLVVGSDLPTAAEYFAAVAKEPKEEIFESPEPTPKPDLADPGEDLLAKVTNTPPPPIKTHTVRNGPPKRVAVNSKEAREARRQRAKELTEMSGAEILDSLVKKDMDKRRGDSNQFVSEGTDTPAPDDGELEIG